MKNQRTTNAKPEKALSWPLLGLCFMSGVLLATILFLYYGHGIKLLFSGLSH